ncbi:MAG: STAS domain-containing protein [Terriglobales bacterium]
MKQLPESVSGSQAHQLFREVAPIVEGDRPRLVFDFSEVRQLDSSGIEMLLRCMEEAMKRNGDVKLAAVSPQAAVILKLTRVDRLFEIFEKPSDAVESFHSFPVQAFGQTTAPKDYGVIG